MTFVSAQSFSTWSTVASCVWSHHTSCVFLCWVCIKSCGASPRGRPRVCFPLPKCVISLTRVFIVRFLPTPMLVLFTLCRLMSTDRIWEHWEKESVTNFPVTFLLLCVSAGDFSRQLTSTWRRAAPPEWWPTRVSRSSPYQVKQVSLFSSGHHRCKYLAWKNLVLLLLFLSGWKRPAGQFVWKYNSFPVNPAITTTESDS